MKNLIEKIQAGIDSAHQAKSEAERYIGAPFLRSYTSATLSHLHGIMSEAKAIQDLQDAKEKAAKEEKELT